MNNILQSTTVQVTKRLLTTFKFKNFLLKRKMSNLENVKFDNLVLRSLPIDPEEKNFVRTVNGANFSRVQPKPVTNPKTVAYSVPALELLDLTADDGDSQNFAEYFSGNKLLPGAEPASHCYCGHQFGYFAGQLGDGAAMYLGEVINKKGERWEIQLKGAGPTPYSRDADGRKVLRSSVREFLCSEAMHHLGIGTTRATSCVTSDSTVVRDIFYSGCPKDEKCTIVCRVAPTFIRLGSFEIFKPLDKTSGRRGPSLGRNDILQQMLEYVISTFFPQIHSQHAEDKTARYKAFYEDVVRSTARLVAGWQCVGFCHGVLNTDNISIMGLTIDYGPFGFMDYFNPDHICNTSDEGGRYTYIKQPEICEWNLLKFAEALEPVLPLDESLKILKESYTPEFNNLYMSKMKEKLGITRKDLPDDRKLIESFLDTMARTGADFTNSFRCLSLLPYPGSPEYDERRKNVQEVLTRQCCSLDDLKRMNRPTMDQRSFMMFMMLIQQNPELLSNLGNAPMAFKREVERRERLQELEKINGCEKTQQDSEAWAAWLDEYDARLRQEVEGLSGSLEEANVQRKKTMNGANPRYVLRNYIAQAAIEAAEKGDFSEVRNVLKVLEDPYSLSDDSDDQFLSTPRSDSKTRDEDGGSSSGAARSRPYDAVPPSCALGLRVSCSS